MNRKETAFVVLSLLFLLGLSWMMVGPPLVAALLAFIAAWTAWAVYYERTHHAQARTNTNREALLADLERLNSVYAPFSIRQSTSVRQAVSRTALLILLWPTLVVASLLHWLLSLRD